MAHPVRKGGSKTPERWALTHRNDGSICSGVFIKSGVANSLVMSEAYTLELTKPDAPVISGVTAGDGSVEVAFTPAFDGGSAVTQYMVTSSGGQTATGSSSPITVTGLTNGTAYTFTVTATNAVGVSAASTASAEVTPATVPQAPTNVTAVSGNGQATVSFDPPADNGGSTVTEYTVTSSGGQTATGSSSPITVTGLTNGTSYTFTVTATNAVGSSNASDSSSPVTPYIPYVPEEAITVTAPVTGATPNATASVVGSVYFTAGAVTWSPTVTTFAGSTPYTATVTLTANSGYVFASTLTTATINGNAATVTDNTGVTVTLSYTFAETATEITSAAITVTPPATGAAPSATASVGTANFTAGVVTWSPTVTTFAGSTPYTATVTLTANSGYVFASTLTTATINGNAATVTNNTGATVTLSYDFAATAVPGGGGGGSTSISPSTPPEAKPEPTQQPTVEVFNRNIVNSASLVEKLVAQVAAAKEATTMMDFADTQGHWAKQTIDTFLKLQLISGYEDGTFRPNGTITRAEFATMLRRAFNIQVGNSSNIPFTDLDMHWAKDDIENLVAAGVINGYTDGTFRPNQTITREEMVVMLSRIVNLSGLEKDTTKGNFNDLGGAYAAAEITALAQASIVSGKGNGSFEPKSNATRAEALQIILNVLKHNPQLKTLLESLS